jgi:hypothetical protein
MVPTGYHRKKWKKRKIGRMPHSLVVTLEQSFTLYFPISSIKT